MYPQDEKRHLKTRNSSIMYYSDLPIEEQKKMTPHSSSSDKNSNNAIMRSRISLPWILSAIATVLLLSVPLLVLDCDYCFSSSKQQLVAAVTSTTSDDSTAAAASASGIISKTGGEIVVITGATGRLGSRLYFELQRNEQVSEVRAIVRTRERARLILGCNRCDESEGIYLGDITDPNGLDSAMEDGKVTTLAIASGANMSTTEEELRAVEFDGVVYSVRSLVMNSNSNNKSLLKVVLCSSMGTTTPPSPSSFGKILHWKLNAEAFLSTAGISSFIVKPCGLKDDLPTNYALYTGNFDTPSKYYTVTRDNVAHVMTEAVIMSTNTNRNDSDEQEQQHHQHYRFDLCSKPGSPITDYKKLIEDSIWE